MNHLEEWHANGLVEIFKTSTLNREFRHWPKGQRKVQNYAKLGAGYLSYLTGDEYTDNSLGATANASRLHQIHFCIFGEMNNGSDGGRRSIRDSLHIDQANQNGVDYFLTADNRVLEAGIRLTTAGITVRVSDPETCLREIRDYFIGSFGTDDIHSLRQRLDEYGPIMIGSNSCGGTAFVDTESKEVLLAFSRNTIGVGIHTRLRDPHGRLLLEVVPGQALEFPIPGASVKMEAGPAPILLGQDQCRAFAIISEEDESLLAGRVLKNARFMIYRATLRTRSGDVVFSLQKGDLSVSGGLVAPYEAGIG